MSKINLNSGFLFMYDWMPMFESLTGSDVKRVMLALINRQRYGTPLPTFKSGRANDFARMIEPTIARRLQGQSGAEAAKEYYTSRTASKGDATPTPSTAEQRTAQLINPPPPSSLGGESAEDQCGGGGGGGSGEDNFDYYREQNFEDFFALYPKHEHKAEAKEAYYSAVKTEAEVLEVLELVRLWRDSEAWNKDGGRWIKRADKFLTEIFPTRDKPPAPTSDGGSFETDEFFEAALRRSWEYTGTLAENENSASMPDLSPRF